RSTINHQLLRSLPTLPPIFKFSNFQIFTFSHFHIFTFSRFPTQIVYFYTKLQTMPETVLQLKNATIFQDNRTILSDVSLEVTEGEFIYIIGKTGAGKSSLMKTLYADLPLHEGEGKIVGFDLK